MLKQLIHLPLYQLVSFMKVANLSDPQLLSICKLHYFFQLTSITIFVYGRLYKKNLAYVKLVLKF
jgi:hypothetical protein